MDYTGLIHKDYKFNRELTAEERKHQLKQKQRLESTPCYDLSVVKLNSTYLDLVDRYYAWRGVLFLFMGGMLVMFLGMLSYGVAEISGRWPLYTDEQQTGLLGLGVFLLVTFGPLFAFLVWVTLKESFTHTYFPIRLNRRNRKVYVFRPGRPGKPILTADWDKLFFTLSPCRKGAVPGQNWDIRGHVLADDGKTVLDTFALSVHMDESGIEGLREFWEFVRRYMEEGPQEAHKLVEVCMPLENKRESLAFAYQRFSMNFYPGGRWLWLMLYPLWLLCILGRWIAGLTCRPPVWPAEIEAQCSIEPGDPYVRDASMNPPDVARQSGAYEQISR